MSSGREDANITFTTLFAMLPCLQTSSSIVSVCVCVLGLTTSNCFFVIMHTHMQSQEFQQSSYFFDESTVATA